MIEKEKFGELFSEELEIGDIVEWTTWNSKEENWDHNYGVLMSICNEVRTNHIVSISKVMPINGIHIELEFFTMSLRKVTKQERSF
jgi:hypothetical protein|tara:strand:- start:325 stop:582 length:258 start_codon:yes stop_codon:yes gene_type:complete